jgi:hypothetical protein
MTSHSLDASLQLIADHRRRGIVQHLRHETDGTTTFDELVDRMHRRDSDSTDDPRPSREELAIQLHHTHLPKLADHGLVDVDLRSGIVRYHPDERVETMLDSLPSEVVVSNP